MQKIHNKWKNTEVDFDMYFVRQEGAEQHSELGEMPVDWIEEELGIKFIPNPNAINILFTQNTADGQVPMTAWTIGHRVGHAFARTWGMTSDPGETAEYFLDAREIAEKVIREIWQSAYGPIDQKVNYLNQEPNNDDSQKLKYLSQAIGSMKSARDGNIRNFGEFVYELFGQYLLQGQIKFRNLPKQLTWNNTLQVRTVNDSSSLKELSYKLQSLANALEQKFSQVLHSAVGKVFVM